MADIRETFREDIYAYLTDGIFRDYWQTSRATLVDPAEFTEFCAYCDRVEDQHERWCLIGKLLKVLED